MDEWPIITIEQTEPIPQGFVLGVDLGSMSDRTALVVDEWSVAMQTMFKQANAMRRREAFKIDKVVHHAIRALHRPATGVAYPAIVEQIRYWLEDLPKMPRKPILAVDGTGLGGPVCDYLRKERLDPFAIVITGGGKAEINGMKASVPKSHLAGCMSVALETGRLKISADLHEAAVFLREMQQFKVKISAAGHEQFESGEGSTHDDIVLAACIALYTAEHKRPTLTAEELAALNALAKIGR